MRKYLSIPAILMLWVIVHVDWHLARSHHHPLSMEWRQHWIVGLIAMFALAIFCAWRWPERFAKAALLNAVIGLLLGHIGEAWLEALQRHASVSSELTPERWHVFFEFAAAGFAGLLAGTVLVIGRRGWRRKS